MTALELDRMTDEGCPHDTHPGAGALPLAFSEYPHRDRMRYRQAIDDAGGEVEGYNGRFVTVAVPLHRGAFFNALYAAGLEVIGASWYFPLGTDAPAQHLRHDGGYKGIAAFWLFANLAPMAPPSAPSDY